MRITTARLSIAAAVSAPLAVSLLVAPDSPCSKFCGNVLSSTATDEIPCDSGTLTQTAKGLVWEQCVDCMLTSTYALGNQTDLQWLLCMPCSFPFSMTHLRVADPDPPRQPAA